MNIELHIITNCIKAAPSTVFIDRAYKSFCDTFGKIPTVVWCDPSPNKAAFGKYRDNLVSAGFKAINETASLAESYIGVMETSKADYIFVLEHDWLFCRRRIKHDLNQIMTVMKADGLYYLRFNQVANYVRGWDRELTEKDCDGFKYLISNCWSGNPHILDRARCLALDIPGRVRARDSKTAEKKLTDDSDLTGAIYGGLNYHETIVHCDGRGETPKPFWTPRQISIMKNKNPHKIIKIGVCIPWRENKDRYRLESKLFVENYYSEVPVYIGTSPGKTFNRAAALNAAAAAAMKDNSRLDVLFFVDSDTVVPLEQFRIASCLAKAENKMIVAFDDYFRLDKQSTKRFVHDAENFTGSHVKGHVSGAVAVPVDLFKKVGGFDERFKTWGGEDRSFCFSVMVAGGDAEPLRIPGTAYHLFHRLTPEKQHGFPGYRANIKLAMRYKQAAGYAKKAGILPVTEPGDPDLDAILKILSEAGAPLNHNFKTSGRV